MTSSTCARRAARFLSPLAPVLLAIPLLALLPEVTDWSLSWWKYDHAVVTLQVPRVVMALLAASAALAFVCNARRRVATGLGIAAVIAALSVSLAWRSSGWIWWTGFGVFGDEGEHRTLNLAWSLGTLIVLLCVPRAPGSAAEVRVRDRVLGTARFVPAWLGAATAVVMLHLAWNKVQSMIPVKCPDPWLDRNLVATTAELWTGVLVLLPATRRTGLRFGILVMEATAAITARYWVTDVPSRGCGCFGGIEAPWWVHSVVAFGLALAMGAAYFRERKLYAASRCARAAHARATSRFPAVWVWCRAFRRAHRLSVRHDAWARPAFAVVLGGVGVWTLGDAFFDLLAGIAHEPHPGWGRFAFTLAWGVVPFAAATYLVRPYLRADVVEPLLATVASARERVRGAADALVRRLRSLAAAATSPR